MLQLSITACLAQETSGQTQACSHADVPVSIFQAVIDVLQHDIFNEHMPGAGFAARARKEVLQSTNQRLQRPLAVDRHNLLSHLRKTAV